ncbi:hypothetical protein [Arthrobacter sp. efr-133-TYG-118]|uniref:hypothetical protein n=1 Tax=Arthrobacter sp. efr-133-TYG-118 TaxID=3040279 RepID=UPI002551BDBD|nr:hypothetical protein [Arthrobacter sp. efr-133-TYG-118]
MDYGIVSRDIALLVLEFLKVLAWPGVVLAGLWTFRDQIRHILHRVKEAAFGGATISFAENTSELSEMVERIPNELKKKDEGSVPPPSVAHEPEEPDSETTELLDAANAQIISRWAALTNDTWKLHQTVFMGSGGTSTSYAQPKTLLQAVSDFQRNGLINNDTLEAFRFAQNLKTNLLHDTNAATFEAYRQFLSTIDQLSGHVRSWISKWTSVASPDR